MNRGGWRSNSRNHQPQNNPAKTVLPVGWRKSCQLGKTKQGWRVFLNLTKLFNPRKSL